MRGVVEVLVVGAVQDVGVVHQRLVHLLAVVEMREGAAHARIVQRRAAAVQREALEAHGLEVRDFLLHDPLAVELLAGGLVGPDVRGIDGEEIELALQEGLERVVAFLEEPEPQHVEVGDLPEPRQVGRPPVRPPCERHLEPRAQLPEAVRPRDHGKIEVQAVEILVSEGVLGQHLQADQRQEIFPMLFLRDEADGGGVEHLGRFEAFEADLVGPGQVLRIHHGRERPAHVFGGHGLSVAPFRQRVHVERERLAVVADDAAVGQHRLGFQRERMQRHQRLVELAEQLGRHHVLVEVVVEALGIRPQVGHEHPALLREFRRERIRRFLPARTRKDFCGGRRGSQQRQSHSQHDAFHAGILPSAAGLGKPECART